MLPKLRKSKKATNATSSSSAVESDQMPAAALTCDGCTDAITEEESLIYSLCKVRLHCYCAGVPKCHFSDILSTFCCIPCSLSSNNSVATELRSEITALKAEISELKAALESANNCKKLETASTAADVAAGAEWSAVVKRSSRPTNRNRNSSTRKPRSNPATTGHVTCSKGRNNRSSLEAGVEQASKVKSHWSMGNSLELHN